MPAYFRLQRISGDSPLLVAAYFWCQPIPDVKIHYSCECIADVNTFIPIAHVNTFADVNPLVMSTHFLVPLHFWWHSVQKGHKGSNFLDHVISAPSTESC